MRDRLIEIIKKVPYGVSVGAKFEQHFCEKVADCLLENGVIVPPCRVGDMVYFVQSEKIYSGKVILIRPFIHKDNTIFHGNVEYECEDPFYNDGRKMRHQVSVVFQKYGCNMIAYLTKEQAEKALAEVANGT